MLQHVNFLELARYHFLRWEQKGVLSFQQTEHSITGRGGPKDKSIARRLGVQHEKEGIPQNLAGIRSFSNHLVSHFNSRARVLAGPFYRLFFSIERDCARHKL